MTQDEALEELLINQQGQHPSRVWEENRDYLSDEVSPQAEKKIATVQGGDPASQYHRNGGGGSRIARALHSPRQKDKFEIGIEIKKREWRKCTRQLLSLLDVLSSALWSRRRPLQVAAATPLAVHVAKRWSSCDQPDSPCRQGYLESPPVYLWQGMTSLYLRLRMHGLVNGHDPINIGTDLNQRAWKQIRAIPAFVSEAPHP
ncbi:hypothetical protein EV363DRAFT_1505051 [Boletus edulis]|nr:hypothetical protein EV363DRAFT_1505051 [Boletus edulis]